MKEQIAECSVESAPPASARVFACEPFVPHPSLQNGHAQTLAGSLMPRRFSAEIQEAQARYFETVERVKVLAHCSWQPDRSSRATLILLHGMEGSSDSRYMLGSAEKALRAGFNAIRLNMRNCGGTEHLTSTLYHAGLTEDLRAIVSELEEKDGLDQIYVAGFSLGGNVVLKLAGEYGAEAPRALRGVIGVSPSIDLAACADAIEMKSNLIYGARFILSLRARLRRKAELFPRRYDTSQLRGVWTIRKYDDAYVAPHWGFRDAADYYERASALRVIDRIAIPALIIHAKDDPFIPCSQFARAAVTANPNIEILATDHGGHVGFISASEGSNRFWAERMVVEFVRRQTGDSLDVQNGDRELQDSVG